MGKCSYRLSEAKLAMNDPLWYKIIVEHEVRSRPRVTYTKSATVHFNSDLDRVRFEGRLLPKVGVVVGSVKWTQMNFCWAVLVMKVYPEKHRLCQGHQPFWICELLLVYRSLQRATSLIHTSEIKFLHNLLSIVLVLIFINVTTLIMLLLFLEQVPERPTCSMRGTWCPPAPRWWSLVYVLLQVTENSTWLNQVIYPRWLYPFNWKYQRIFGIICVKCNRNEFIFRLFLTCLVHEKRKC